MVRSSTETVHRSSFSAAQKPRSAVTTSSNGSKTSVLGQDKTDPFQNIREALQTRGLSSQTSKIITEAWRNSTKSQYKNYIQKWIQFCSERQASAVQISINLVLEFFTVLFNKGLSYSALNSAKAAVLNYVSLISGVQLNLDMQLITKFMKGVFSARPALPRYGVTWDVAAVLKYLKSQSPLEALTCLALSRKLAMLLLLLSGQRGQSIHLLEIKAIECQSSVLILRFNKLLKTSRPGKHLEEIVLPAFEQDPSLCVVTTYKAYVARTKRYRKGQGKLFLSTLKPFKPITRDTFGKWIKFVLGQAGIDLAQFGVHSTRVASTSMAWSKGVPLQTIIRTAGWEADNTFRKFYKRPVTRSGDFAQSILTSSVEESTS